ncbi:MAG TPA: hypothetical protein VLO30_00830 [Chthoniobacterales bacterium]|nr:hypothetical protein [Chthoniobacterales bacterium]
MNRSRPFSLRGAWGMAALLFLTLVTGSLFAGERTSALILDGPSNPAKNLARLNCGAAIDLVGADGRIVAVTNKDSSANSLLLDDNTLSYALPEGDTTFLLSFPRTFPLDRFTFVNENSSGAGELKIAVSKYRLPVRSPKWNEVNSSSFTGKRLFDLSLLRTEARFVKLSFHVSRAGRIAGLGLYGGQSLQQFAARQRGVMRVTNPAATHRMQDMLNFNFLNLYAGARIVFVSSGTEEQAQRMIDDNVVTAFQFAPADPSPTVVVELAELERLHRVSAVYKMEKGRLDVFALENLKTNPGDLAGETPVASVTDTTGAGKAAVEFDTHGARFVALRWTPTDANTPHEFELAEVGAFGEMSLSMLSTQELPDIYADNTIGLMSPPLVIQAPVLPLVSP